MAAGKIKIFLLTAFEAVVGAIFIEPVLTPPMTLSSNIFLSKNLTILLLTNLSITKKPFAGSRQAKYKFSFICDFGRKSPEHQKHFKVAFN